MLNDFSWNMTGYIPKHQVNPHGDGIFNLVENACKYGRQGGHIQITAQKADAEIIVSVEDDGPGIAPEHLPYIFDAFYRVDKSRSREMGGSGLGLSIVKSMIEASGGRIIADSDGSSGSKFTVTLPAFISK